MSHPDLVRNIQKLRVSEDHVRAFTKMITYDFDCFSDHRIQYQPMVCYSSGQVIGFEAIVRRGLSRVDDPASEALIGSFRMQRKLGDLSFLAWTLITSQRHRSDFPDHLQSLPIHICLTCKELEHPFLPKVIKWIANEVDLKAICFEVSASSSMTVTSAIAQSMQQVIELGFQFSLARFGNGSANLDALNALPFSAIKVDQAFINDIAQNERSQKVMANIIAIAHSLDMSIIASGVETVEQANMLFSLGCVNIEGVAIARPMPADKLAIWHMGALEQNEWWLRT
jgi:EAL domain-containing protein (putative c-di-GMP-specific phosphodiesterase class I)